jgi:hypothetical protein
MFVAEINAVLNGFADTRSGNQVDPVVIRGIEGTNRARALSTERWATEADERRKRSLIRYEGDLIESLGLGPDEDEGLARIKRTVADLR